MDELNQKNSVSVGIWESEPPFAFDPNNEGAQEKLALANRIGTGKVIKQKRIIAWVNPKRNAFKEQRLERQRKIAARKAGRFGSTGALPHKGGKFSSEGGSETPAKGYIHNLNRGGKSVFSKGSGKSEKK